jgi:hypothetical protein
MSDENRVDGTGAGAGDGPWGRSSSYYSPQKKQMTTGLRTGVPAQKATNTLYKTVKLLRARRATALARDRTLFLLRASSLSRSFEFEAKRGRASDGKGGDGEG